MRRGYLALAALLALGCPPAALVSGAEPAPAAQPAAMTPEEASACLTAAKAGVEDGLYPLAQKQVERYLDFAAAAQQLPAGTGEAVGLLMRALYAQKQYADMLQFMEKHGAALLRSDPSALAYWPAVAHYEVGAPEKALQLLGEPRAATPAGSCTAQILRLRAWCLLRLGRLDEAVVVFDTFLKSASATGAREKLEWAGALVERGRLAPASAILNALVAAPGVDPRLLAEARFWLGRVAVLENRPAAAIPLLQASAAESLREDLRVDAWINMGRAYQGITNSELAIASLTNAVELAREPALKRRAVRALGAMYLQAGRLDDAAAVLRPYVATAPDDPESPAIQLKLGEAYLSGGRWNEAVREYQQYMETFTNQAGRLQAQEGQGWALAGAGRHGEAAGAFAKAADPPGLYKSV
jgi:tetratricopeptide (TPR) repeat protein